MKYKAVLFDMDGTLIDSSELIFQSLAYALDTVLHVKIPREELLWTFSRPLATIMDTLGGAQSEELQKAFRAYSQIHETEIALFPYVKETLAYLHRHDIKTAIVTSRIAPSTMHNLEITGLASSFDVIITPESTSEHKPHPAPAQKALKQLGIAPQDAIMIGDGASDLLCGREAGCNTAFVAYSLQPPEDLLACNPDYCFQTLQDLISLLEEDLNTHHNETIT